MTELEKLSEKEKEALRLIVRGHDAKSMAHALSLSVHTINERLRAARRKLEVTSSKEAARLLYESERGTYENPAYEGLGDAANHKESHRPSGGHLRPLWIGGVLAMLGLGLVSLLVLSPVATGDRPSEVPAAAPEIVLDTYEMEARAWLAMVDAGNWEASYAKTAPAFRARIAPDEWQSMVSRLAQTRGNAVARELDSFGSTSLPSMQVRKVFFRNRFANGRRQEESVSFIDADADYMVIGYTVGVEAGD